MSTAFAGSDTRGLSDLDKEIEYRLGRRKLDTFTDDFSPPGASEGLRPGEVKKPGNGYQAKHDDTVPRADPSFTLHAAGNAKDQQMLDEIDADVQKRDGGIKKPADQVPGAKMSGDSVHAAVEKRMRLSAVPAVKGTTSIAVMTGKYILMGRRRDNGKWTLPGGGMNDGELPLVGALRELREEAGISGQALQPLGSEVIEGRTGRKVEVHVFLLTAPARLATKTGQDPDQECAAWEWIDCSTGLPAEVVDNLQSPRNLVLQKVGLL